MLSVPSLPYYTGRCWRLISFSYNFLIFYLAAQHMVVGAYWSSWPCPHGDPWCRVEIWFTVEAGVCGVLTMCRTQGVRV